MTDFPLKLALTAQETLAETIDCLTSHISLETKGACDPKSLFQILVRAASKRDTIEKTTKELEGISCSNNIRYHLKKINNFNPLEKQLNLSLKSQMPKGLKKKRQAIAIDLNLIPDYGNPSPEEAPYIYRSQAKNGTCSFYAYATLYVIKKGKRVTLAIRGVRWLDTKVAIITYLLAKLSTLKIKV